MATEYDDIGPPKLASCTSTAGRDGQIHLGPFDRAEVDDSARDQYRKNVTNLDNLKQQATRIFRRHRHRIPAGAWIGQRTFNNAVNVRGINAKSRQ